MKCSIKGCKSYKINKGNVTYHKFPLHRDQEITKKWIKSIGTRIRKVTKHSLVCSQHFEGSCFRRNLQIVRLQNDAIPTIFQNKDEMNSDDEKSLTSNSDIAEYMSMLEDLETTYPEQVEVTPSIQSMTSQGSKYKESATMTEPTVPKPMNIITEHPEDEVTKLRRICKTQKMLINRLRVQCHRQKKRVTNLESIIQDLKNQQIEFETSDFINSFNFRENEEMSNRAPSSEDIIQNTNKSDGSLNVEPHHRLIGKNFKRGEETKPTLFNLPSTRKKRS